MGLENIPEMELMVVKYGDLHNARPLLPEDIASDKYVAKFLLLQIGLDQTFLFGSDGCEYHSDVLGHFRERFFGESGIIYADLIALGGGYVSVYRDEIILEDGSASFGKYDPEIAIPIVNRYVRENFPDIPEIKL